MFKPGMTERSSQRRGCGRQIHETALERNCEKLSHRAEGEDTHTAAHARCAITPSHNSTSMVRAKPRSAVSTTERSDNRPPASAPTVMPNAEEREDEGDGAERQARSRREQRRYVGIDGEHAAKSHRTRGEYHPEWAVPQGSQFARYGGLALDGEPRDPPGDGDHRSYPEHGYANIGKPPAQGPSRPGDQRHADDVRHGEARHHDRHRAAPFLRGRPHGRP